MPTIQFSRQATRRKTQDTYGHISSSTSGQLDLFGAFGKTLQDTPRWGYGESCPIWKKKVIDARGAYSQRKKLALHTKGNECSYLETTQRQLRGITRGRTQRRYFTSQKSKGHMCGGTKLHQVRNAELGNSTSKRPHRGSENCKNGEQSEVLEEEA